MLVLAIVVGLQTVGVVLMSAMVVAPAAAARQWTNALGRMVVLSALFGALAGISGAMISSSTPGVATGPAVVLAVTSIVIVSLLLAPERGVVWRALERRRRKHEIRADAVLLDLYALAAQHDMREHAHRTDVLVAMRPGVGVERSLDALEEQGYADRQGERGWLLTSSGRDHARDLLRRGGHDE
jgi:manganese/zinc/iron transport system permease protein